MFCNACGSQIQPQFNVCPHCGQPIVAVSLTLPSRLARHLRTLGILWIVAGSFFAIPGLALMTISSVVRLGIPASENVGHFIGPLILSFLGGSIFVVAVGGVLVGWGLLKHQPWARGVAIVLGILSLFHPPFGTALGIYTLWVLVSDASRAEYDRLTRAA